MKTPVSELAPTHALFQKCCDSCEEEWGEAHMARVQRYVDQSSVLDLGVEFFERNQSGIHPRNNA